MPSRIQRKRTKGWRQPPGVVYVGRPTLFGNPFKPGDRLVFPYEDVFGPVVRDKAHAAEVFAAYAEITSGYDLLVRYRLAGRDLSCYCPVGAPCHADTLLAIANQPEDP